VSVNEELLDLTLRHAIRLHKFTNGEVRSVLDLLEKTQRDLIAKIQGRDISGDTSSFTRRRLDALLESIKEIISSGYNEITRRTQDGLSKLVELEAEWAAKTLQTAIPVRMDVVTPSTELLKSAISEIPFEGRLLSEWRENLSLGAFDRAKTAIRIGVVQGETNEQIVRRLRGTRANNFKDGALNISRKSAKDFVRTATATMANYARGEVYAANADIVKGYTWVATLDLRVCVVCSALDGKTFPLDGTRKPPEHRGCRCTTVPVTKSWRELGIDLDELPEGTRASMNGQVPAKIKFDDWLRKQSVEHQEEILGVTKAKLFRDGGLTIEDFSTGLGKELTLAQLREAEAQAFKKAGISA